MGPQIAHMIENPCQCENCRRSRRLALHLQSEAEHFLNAEGVMDSADDPARTRHVAHAAELLAQAYVASVGFGQAEALQWSQRIIRDVHENLQGDGRETHAASPAVN